MFQEKLIKALEDQITWQRGQIELIQGKLFKAVRLNEALVENMKPMKYDPKSETFIEKTPKELHEEQQAMAELLSANENPVYAGKAV